MNLHVMFKNCIFLLGNMMRHGAGNHVKWIKPRGFQYVRTIKIRFRKSILPIEHGRELGIWSNHINPISLIKRIVVQQCAVRKPTTRYLKIRIWIMGFTNKLFQPYFMHWIDFFMSELTISWQRGLLYLNTRWSFHILGFEPFELSKKKKYSK